MIVKDELGPKPDQLPLPEAAPPPDYNTTITTPSNVHADAYPFPPGSTPSTRQTPVKETSRYVYKLGDDPSLRSSLEDKPLPPPPDSDDGQLIASTSALYLRAPRSSSNLATDRSAPHHSLSVPLPTLTASSSALDLRSTPSRSNLALGRPRTHSFTPSSQTPLTASSAGFPSPFLTSPFLASPTLTPSTPGSPTPSDGTLGRSWSNMITEANRWLSGRRTSKASAEHVRTTVHQLVRELVERPDAAGAPGVLGACEGLCKSGGQALPALLRERSIEGHTPLYWAIVKFAGARGGGAAGATWLLSALAAHVRPLEGDARSDARLACVEAADNAVYQVLRGIPGFVELSGADRVLFGEQGLEPIDTVEVREDPDVPEFVATFECPLFMQRTRAGRQLQCEFLAKGRLFVLTFRADTRGPGSEGTASLSLLEHSPPAYSHSRFHIIGALGEPVYTVKFKSQHELGPPRRRGTVKELTARIDKGVLTTEIGLAPTGMLRARLEARLVKPPSKLQLLRQKADDSSLTEPFKIVHT